MDKQSRPKKRKGVVVSLSGQSSIVVKFTRKVQHPRFKKLIQKSKSFYVHDEKGEAKLGDKVLIQEIRPISKLKCWKLIEVIS